MKKFYTARYDRVFKTIICNEDKTIYLKKILESILKEEIEEVKILRSELALNEIDERLKIVDLLVKIKESYVHIELNTNYSERIKYRNYIYFTDIINSKTKRGKEYKMEDKFIHIDLTYGMRDESEITEYYVQDNKQNRYIKNLQIIEINMDRIRKLCYSKSEYKYLGMLDLEPKEIKKIAKGDEVMEEYSKEVKELNEKEEFQSFMTQEEQAAWLMEGFKYDARKEGLAEGLAEGRAKGLKEGRKEGRKEAIMEMVVKLNKNGVDINVISNTTGLTKEKILNLINDDN